MPLSTEILLIPSTGFLENKCAEMLFMADRHHRLIEAREAIGFKSARSAAIRQTPLPVDAAIIYGKAFKVSPAWLLTGEGHRRRRQSEVQGYVGAGAEIFPFDDNAPLETIDLPPAAPADTVSVIVRGNSMFPRYFDGEYLFYESQQNAPSDMIGRECVVRLKDGHMFVKTIRRGSKARVFNLESHNGPLLEDKAIEWAARVRGRWS
jgi:SOS-response transcriptional repressor LexA